MRILLVLWFLVGTALTQSLQTLTIPLGTGSEMQVVEASLQDYDVRLLYDPSGHLHDFQWFLERDVRAEAAINGGFFFSNGHPSGFFKDRKWLSVSHKKRAVLGWSESKDVQRFVFDKLQYKDGAIHAHYAQNGWWKSQDIVLGGAGLLVYQGQLVSLSDESLASDFVESTYARSAFCWHKQDKVSFIMVNGVGRSAYRFGFQGGLTLPQFALALQNLGCYYAINLDGGRSATLFADDRWVTAHWTQRVWPKKIANVLVLVKK